MGDPYGPAVGYRPCSRLGVLVTDPLLPGPWWPRQPVPDAELLRRVVDGLCRLQGAAMVKSPGWR